jgi:hypothetical protein
MNDNFDNPSFAPGKADIIAAVGAHPANHFDASIKLELYDSIYTLVAS